MAGSIATMRVMGMPSGYPAEQEADVRVRFVDGGLEVMSDMDIPLLKHIGGISQFEFHTNKIEWQLGDSWTDRGLISGSHDASTTTLTLTAAIAHRFPRGSIFKIGDECVWIASSITTSSLRMVRGYAGTVAAIHADQAAFRVVGFTEVEGTTITFRGTPLTTMAYNYPYIMKTGASESWAQSETEVYGRSGGSTLPQTMADTIAQLMVDMEGTLIEGQRYEGAGVEAPPWAGGLRYFGTSVNGATVIDAGGQKLSRAILNTAFDASWSAVGAMHMARTVLCGIAARRILWEEYKQPIIVAQDPGSQSHREGFNSLENEYGTFDFLGPFKRIPDTELWMVNTAAIEVGHFGALGRLHEFDLATSGDFKAKGLYGMYSQKFKQIPGLVRIYNFTTA